MEYFWPLVPIMTLLNSKRIIIHYSQIPTFAIFKKVEICLKNKKMVKNPQNLSKKLFLSLKYLILLTFKVKNQKKIGHVFLGLLTWNHPFVTIFFFSFVTIWVFEFCHNLSLSFFSQFEFSSFVTIFFITSTSWQPTNSQGSFSQFLQCFFLVVTFFFLVWSLFFLVWSQFFFRVW